MLLGPSVLFTRVLDSNYPFNVRLKLFKLLISLGHFLIRFKIIDDVSIYLVTKLDSVFSFQLLYSSSSNFSSSDFASIKFRRTGLSCMSSC